MPPRAVAWANRFTAEHRKERPAESLIGPWHATEGASMEGCIHRGILANSWCDCGAAFPWSHLAAALLGGIRRSRCLPETPSILRDFAETRHGISP